MLSDRLSPFPWDRVAAVRERAARFDGRVVDLTVGTPVDPTPQVVRQALIDHADAHAYPRTDGGPDLVAAVRTWFTQHRGVPDAGHISVLPTVGSKEFLTWLPTYVGAGGAAGRAGAVAVPHIAYPSYVTGAELAGAPVVAYQDADELAGLAKRQPIALVWINSPSNPTGRVLSAAELAAVVAVAREHGAIVASDECYAKLTWADDVDVPSVLDPRVSGGDVTGLLALYSLSKQSSMAGYRAGFVAGDSDLLASFLAVRKSSGMMVPAPIQSAMLAALADEAHAADVRACYLRRKAILAESLSSVGLRCDGGQAGLYLWATEDTDCWSTANRLADVGVLVTPGVMYGQAGEQHVRVALTVTDDDVALAAARVQQAGAATK